MNVFISQVDNMIHWRNITQNVLIDESFNEIFKILCIEYQYFTSKNK